MTEHLYYHDSFLYEFDAEVLELLPPSNSEPRSAIILDRTAFYPTSGGQVFDTGSMVLVGNDTRSDKLRTRIMRCSARSAKRLCTRKARARSYVVGFESYG